MSSPGDFLESYQNCKTHRDANLIYQALISENPRDHQTRQALMESLRLAHLRIMEDREKPVATGITRTRRDNSDVHDPSVRSWARLTGYVMPRSGRVTNAVRDAYRLAHGMTSDTPQIAQDFTEQRGRRNPNPEGIDIPVVRAWAIANGIPCGTRGRLSPDVIQQWKDAQ